MILLAANSHHHTKRHRHLSQRKRFAILAAFSLATSNLHAIAQAKKIQQQLDRTTSQSGAISLVVDVKTGRLLAAEKPHDAARLHSRPGSVLKPFFLAGALEQNLLRPQTTVFCRRSLRILGRDLACTHPQSNVAFDTDDALAYSCNTWFAELANRLSPAQAVAILQSYGFSEPSRYFTDEQPASLRPPETPEQKQLLILGLDGISISPAQLAAAWRRLALELSDPKAPPVLHTVSSGLAHSVQYGMAHNADVPGLQIAGKTGTASDPGQSWTHGWFAGFATARAATIVVVFYVPHGNGADAASLAQRFLQSWKATP